MYKQVELIRFTGLLEGCIRSLVQFTVISLQKGENA